MCLCVRAHSCYFRQSAGGRMNKAGKNYTKPRDRRYCCTEAILLVREKNMQKIIHWERKQSERCDCGTMLAVRLFSSPLSSLPSFPLVDGGRGSGSVDTDADTFKIIAFAFRITRQHKQSYFFQFAEAVCHPDLSNTARSNLIPEYYPGVSIREGQNSSNILVQCLSCTIKKVTNVSKLPVLEVKAPCLKWKEEDHFGGLHNFRDIMKSRRLIRVRIILMLLSPACVRCQV